MKDYAWMFYLCSIILIVFGIYTMYTYGDGANETGHIVGGDAYNYIVIGIRGVGFLIIGLISALLGATINIYYAIIEKTHTDIQKPEIASESVGAE